MTRPLRAVLSQGAQTLSAQGVAGAARDARLLLADIGGLEVARLSLEPDLPVSPTQQARFEAAIAARLGGKPVSRLLGRRSFWGRDFRITQDVLDPRPETESLIAAALELGPPARLLDLGTGSGIIAVTLLAEWPGAQGVATDLDPVCLRVAEQNAAGHGVAGRLSLFCSDWLDRIEGQYDMILSNPPYIRADEMAGLAQEVRAHDPHLALSPGGDGLDAYRKISAGLGRFLAPNGHVLVEIGPEQGADVAALFRGVGLGAVRVLPDLDGRDRVVIGQKPAPKPEKPM